MASEKNDGQSKPKHPGGRPTKYTKENLLAVVVMAENGYTHEQMAERLQVAKSTFDLWYSKYKEFSDAIKKAKEKPDDQVEKSLFDRANGYSHPAVKIVVAGGEVQEVPYTEHYPPDPTSMIFWLKNRRPDRWRDKQEIEHSGGITTTQLTKEERDAEIAALLARREAAQKT